MQIRVLHRRLIERTQHTGITEAFKHICAQLRYLTTTSRPSGSLLSIHSGTLRVYLHPAVIAPRIYFFKVLPCAHHAFISMVILWMDVSTSSFMVAGHVKKLNPIKTLAKPCSHTYCL